MDRKKTDFGFPLVRNGFAMDISQQEYRLLTGMPDGEEVSGGFCITKGEWANNWVPYSEFLGETAAKEKSSLFR